MKNVSLGGTLSKPRSLAPAEAQVLQACLEYLRLAPKVAWVVRMNTGAGYLTQRGETRARWIAFGFPGCPDLLGQMRDGRILAVEVKAPRGVVGPRQKEFLAVVSDNGGISGVVRSVDEAARLIGKSCD